MQIQFTNSHNLTNKTNDQNTKNLKQKQDITLVNPPSIHIQFNYSIPSSFQAAKQSHKPCVDQEETWRHSSSPCTSWP